MKWISVIKILFVMNIILLNSSCSVEKRVHMKGYHVSFKQFKKLKKTKHSREVEPSLNDTVLAKKIVVTDTSFGLRYDQVTCNEDSIIPQPSLRITTKVVKSRIQRLVLPKVLKKRQEVPKEEKTEDVKNKRRAAVTTGISLILMAILAGMSIPVLGTLTASLGLIGIFLLDLIVAKSIFNYHKDDNLKLAKTTGVLRLLYTLVLGVAIGFHIAGSVSMYNFIWGIGLIIFGAHLFTLGVLYKTSKGKKWFNILIKTLLITAGIGYMLQYIGVILVANPIAFAAFVEPIFIIPMILGEVLYAFWMLIKGGK